MSKEALRLALEALECKDGWGSSSRVLKERAITSLRTTLSASKIEGDLMQRFYDGEEAKSLISEAEETITALLEALAQPQQEPDLSGLKPSTQEVIKGWIEDGTFIERAIGAMQEQEAENMRLEKALAEQPAQGCDHCNHALYAGTKCKNCGRVTEQAAIKRDLTPEQPAQRKPLTDEMDRCASHIEDYSRRDWFITGWLQAEAAHGIKEKNT